MFKWFIYLKSSKEIIYQSLRYRVLTLIYYETCQIILILNLNGKFQSKYKI